MNLSDFWPTEINCRDCLATEAETADEAVFLAVHQPMKVVKTFHNSSREMSEVKREEDVLEALLVPEPSSGTLVLPITGESGVGKSHMIRWLSAHLALHPDSAKRHVVRIPKSASLRGVLDLIFQGLPAGYDELRALLNSARMPVTLHEATQTLNTQLRIALEVLGKTAKARLLGTNARKDDRSRAAHCGEQGLIALLKDPEISNKFDACAEPLGVIARIAHRFLYGNKEHREVEKFCFQENDLDFVLNQTDANLSLVVRKYIPNLRKPEERLAAIGFLNEVVDAALFKLIEMGSASLSDIFVELRKKLLKDGLELVLLVEDFAVLAGVQGPLLDAMIREGIRDGRRELCVMRTAMAVTTGRLPETVLTRARAVWNIESKPFQSDEEALDSFSNFVGGYLNAARLGKHELQRAFTSKSREGSLPKDWIPSFYERHHEQLSDGDRATLNAFGKCERGLYPLFPFNRGAITQMANQVVKEKDSYRFDPRAMLNRIVRETVLGHRPLFLNGAFPPADFAGFSAARLLDPDINLRIQSRGGSQASRLSAFVHYWGDAPGTPGEAAAILNEVYGAFQLSPIDWQARPEPRTTPTRQEDTGGIVVPVGLPEGKWGPILEAWRTKGTIEQKDANALRSALAQGIQSWLDWDSMLLEEKSTTLKGADIWLPKAKVGNPLDPGKAMAVVAEDEALDDARSATFFLAMKAVVRFEVQKSWDYEGGEDDSAIYANLIERLAGETKRWLQKRGPHLRPDLIVPVAQALLIDARALNLEGASAATDAENQSALLSNLQDLKEPNGADAWSKFKAGAITERKHLLDILLRQISARQGGGQPQAVDGSVMLAAIKAVRSNWSLSDLDSALITDSPSSEIREALRRLRGKLESAVQSRKGEVDKWLTKVTSAFGEDFVLTEIQAQMNATLKKAQEGSVFRTTGNTSYEVIRARIKEVGALSTAVEQARRALKPGAAFGSVLAALAQLDDATVHRAEELIDLYADFLKKTGTEVSEKLHDAPPCPDEVSKILLSELASLEQTWTEIGEELKA